MTVDFLERLLGSPSAGSSLSFSPSKFTSAFVIVEVSLSSIVQCGFSTPRDTFYLSIIKLISFLLSSNRVVCKHHTDFGPTLVKGVEESVAGINNPRILVTLIRTQSPYSYLTEKKL